MLRMIVKIFYEYVSQSTTKNVEQDLQKLEDKINMFAGQKGVLIHDVKYETIQKDQMQQMIIAFVHHTAVNEETGEVEKDDIPKIVVEKK
jgi:hypothetical protein